MRYKYAGVSEDRIEFVVKLHSLHSRPDQYFPAGFWEGLSERERVQTLWWTAGFSYSERVMVEAAGRAMDGEVTVPATRAPVL